MWCRLARMIVIGVLLMVPLNPQVAHGESAGIDTRAHISRIVAQGDADDMIPVIVSLQPPVLPRTVLTSPFDLQQRATAIRAIQRDFISRHVMRVTPTERQPQLFAMMFMTMRRADVAAFATDTAVTGVMQDYLSQPTMDVSSVLIGSYSANLSGYDGTGTSVAVLDTGVQSNHQFLSGKVVAEACFSNVYGAGSEWYNGASLCPSGTNTTLSTSNDVGSATPCVFHSSCDHGTHVAGTVAGKEVNFGSYSLRGVAPGAKIIGIQVFSHINNNGGSLSSWSADQISAMEWLIANRNTPNWGVLASLNMSLGGGQYFATCDFQPILTPINSLRTLGIATVIASGNDGYLDSISSPGCISTAITVGSSTTNSAVGYSGVTVADEISPYSNAPAGDNNVANGTGDRLLDLLAPGMYIYSSNSSTSSTIVYGYKSGTSMAAPHVAGAWAVMKQAAANASVSQVLGWLYGSGVTLSDLRPNTNPYLVRYTASPTKIASYVNRTPLSLPRIQVDDAVSTAVAAVTDTPVPTATNTPLPATATNTALPVPVTFAKSIPAHNRINQPLTITLSWAASRGATSYQYCIATTASACTNWRSVGTVRSVTIRNLARNKAYYWNVRALNLYGSTVANGSAWKFTTTNAPALFNKSGSNNLVNRPLTLTLSWAASTGATSYEYCFATTATKCTNWKSVGTARSVTVRSLARNKVYFWNVRSKNRSGTTVANGGVWKFTTIR